MIGHVACSLSVPARLLGVQHAVAAFAAVNGDLLVAPNREVDGAIGRVQRGLLAFEHLDGAGHRGQQFGRGLAVGLQSARGVDRIGGIEGGDVEVRDLLGQAPELDEDVGADALVVHAAIPLRQDGAGGLDVDGLAGGGGGRGAGPAGLQRVVEI